MSMINFNERVGQFMTRLSGYLTVRVWPAYPRNEKELRKHPRTDQELCLKNGDHDRAEVAIYQRDERGRKIIGVVKCLQGPDVTIALGLKFFPQFEIVRATALNAEERKELEAFHLEISQSAPRHRSQAKS